MSQSRLTILPNESFISNHIDTDIIENRTLETKKVQAIQIESLLICDSNFNSSDQFSLTQYPIGTSSFLSPAKINQSQPLLRLNKDGTLAKKRGPKGPRKK